MAKFGRLGLATVLIALMLFFGPEGTSDTPDQRQAHHEKHQEEWLIGAINYERTSRGIKALQPHGEMSRAAKEYSRKMAEDGWLRHSNNIREGTPSGTCLAGENVAIGQYVRTVHHRFMQSKKGHAENTINPRWDYVGVGVAWNGRNALNVTVRFADVC